MIELYFIYSYQLLIVNSNFSSNNKMLLFKQILSWHPSRGHTIQYFPLKYRGWNYKVLNTCA